MLIYVILDNIMKIYLIVCFNFFFFFIDILVNFDNIYKFKTFVCILIN